MTVVAAVSDRRYGLMRVLRSEGGEVIGLVSEREASRQQRAIRECTSGVFACSRAALREGLATFSWEHVERERSLGEFVGALRRLGHDIDTITANVPQEVRGINSQTELAEASAMMRQAKCEELMSAGVDHHRPGHYLRRPRRRGRPRYGAAPQRLPRGPHQGGRGLRESTPAAAWWTRRWPTTSWS